MLGLSIPATSIPISSNSCKSVSKISLSAFIIVTTGIMSCSTLLRVIIERLFPPYTIKYLNVTKNNEKPNLLTVQKNVYTARL